MGSGQRACTLRLAADISARSHPHSAKSPARLVVCRCRFVYWKGWQYQVVYPNSAVNSIAPKTGYNAPISRPIGGGNTMVSHLFYYHLALLALVGLVLIVHVT